MGNFSSAAQVKECPLDLSVTLYQKNADADERPTKPISDAEATATNVATKKVSKAVLLEGMPRFLKLPEGTYDLSVTKAGYARTFKRVKVNCGGLSEDGSVSEDIWLWEGSAEQSMRMRNVSMKLTSKDNVPIPSAEIRDSKTETRGIKRISAGVLNGKAKSLAKPPYPAAARAVKATGAVNVQVEIDEQGKVISATAVSGHPLLRQAAEKAARESSFAPTLLSGNPVKVSGILVFNFAL